MGLKMRITYKEKDFVYEIVNGAAINKETTELKVILNGEPVTLSKGAGNVWVQQDGDVTIEPDLAQALGRSVSLRYRM
jgi:hypothetical protein